AFTGLRGRLSPAALHASLPALGRPGTPQSLQVLSWTHHPEPARPPLGHLQPSPEPPATAPPSPTGSSAAATPVPPTAPPLLPRDACPPRPPGPDPGCGPPPHHPSSSPRRLGLRLRPWRPPDRALNGPGRVGHLSCRTSVRADARARGATWTRRAGPVGSLLR